MKAAALVALLLAAPAIAEPTDHMLPLPDGRVLNLWCDGRKGPVVVLDSGWAADSRAWKQVMTRLAGDYRVCAQDRAGAGKSDAGPLPRDGEAVARDLKAALAAGSVPGPYILVGHSLGALNMRHFARLYPAETAALVLVDPSTPTPGIPYAPAIAERARNCLAAVKESQLAADAALPARCRTTPPEKAAIRWEARLSEIDSVPLSTSAGLAGQSLGVPLIVLSAGGTVEPPEATAARLEAHRQLAGISPKGSSEIVDGSGHMMMFDRPDAIIEAVKSVAPLRTPQP